MSHFDPSVVDLSCTQQVPICRGVITTTGAGKSTSIRKQIDALLQSHSGGMAVIFMPNINLGREQLEEIKSSLSHYTVEQYLGVGQEDPNQPGQKMCPRDGAVDLVNSGVSLKQLCGNSKKGYCAFHHSTGTASPCGYSVQATKKADVWVMSHASLFHKKPVFMKSPLLLKVIDESFFDVSFSEQKLDADELLNPVNYRPGSYLAVLSSHVHKDLMMMPDGYLDAMVISNYVNNSLVDSLGTVSKVSVNVDHQSGAADLKNALKQFKGSRRFSVDVFWSLVAAVPMGASGRVPTMKKVTETDKHGAKKIYLKMRYSRGIHSSWDSLTVLLDSTMPAEINRVFFKNLQVTKTHTESRYTRYLQVSDSLLSKTQFARTPSTYQHIVNLLKVKCSLIADHHSTKVLLVSSKDGEDEFNALGLPKGVETLHFGAVTGSNRFSHVPCIVIAGRNEIPVAAAEKDAAILGGRLLGQGYPSTNFYKRTVSVKGCAIRAYYHPDPLTEEIRRSVNEDQIMQAIGRGRSIRRTYKNPLEVIILTSVPLPLDENLLTLTTWKEVQPTIVELLLAEHGIVPLGMGEMQRHFFMEFPSPKVARSERDRFSNKYPEVASLFAKKTKVSALSSIRIIYRQKGTYFTKPTAIIRYTPHQKGAKPSLALVQKEGSKSVQQQLDEMVTSKPLQAITKKEQKKRGQSIHRVMRGVGKDAEKILNQVVPDVTYKIVGVMVDQPRELPDKPKEIHFYDPEEQSWVDKPIQDAIAECGVVKGNPYYYLKRVV